MNIICIIAGGGKLPIRLYEKLQYDKNNIVYLLGIKNHFKNLKYFSSEYKKNFYRSLDTIENKISNFSENLIILKNDTNNIVEFVEYQKNENKKKYHFWKLLNNDK